MKDTRRNNPQEKSNFIGRQLNEWEQKRELDMANIHDLMERWGAWAASDSCGVDWKPIAAGFKSLIPYGKKSRVQCTDDEGLLIDSLVTKLCRRRPEMYEVLIAHFVMGISLRAIARRLKCSDGTIRKKLESALAFVEGGLVSTQNV